MDAGAEIESVEAALAHLRGGGGLAFPTETSWGLAVDATQPAAVAGLRAWKGRAEDQPLAVLVRDVAALPELGLELPAIGRSLAEAFWPGPLTLVVPAAGQLAPGVAREDGALGLRCSPHPVAAALVAAAAAAGLGPLTATSLNRSGDAAACRRSQAARLCAERRGGAWAPRLLALPGPDAGGGEPSSVLDLSGAAPVMLRSAAITWDSLETVLRGRRSA